MTSDRPINAQMRAQIDCFKEAAATLDTDEDEAAFEAKLAVIAQQKPKGDTLEPPKDEGK